MTPRLPLRLHGLRIPRPPRRGCVLRVEGLRQGGGGEHDCYVSMARSARLERVLNDGYAVCSAPGD
jgi:hypothetical protein